MQCQQRRFDRGVCMPLRLRLLAGGLIARVLMIECGEHHS